MTTTQRLLGLALALTLTPFAIGCGPPPGPDNPSFEKDIKPIMLAHCVRCHGAGGTLNEDPDNIGPYRKDVPVFAYLDSYEAPASCAAAGCQGARIAAETIKAYVTLTDDTRMPPLPAAPLSDHQIGIIVRWASQTPAAP
jgi:mono/diheme cytochrome c family protein